MSRPYKKLRDVFSNAIFLQVALFKVELNALNFKSVVFKSHIFKSLLCYRVNTYQNLLRNK